MLGIWGVVVVLVVRVWGFVRGLCSLGIVGIVGLIVVVVVGVLVVVGEVVIVGWFCIVVVRVWIVGVVLCYFGVGVVGVWVKVWGD